jgi:coenzyme F420-reducing hydrogenase delta subunit
MPDERHLPRQWHQDGAHVVIQELPCSGKTDAQYLMNAPEGGLRGVCVVTRPKGQRRLEQGNYRASMRARMIQRLQVEMGVGAGRVELVQPSEDDGADDIEACVREGSPPAGLCQSGPPETVDFSAAWRAVGLLPIVHRQFIWEPAAERTLSTAQHKGCHSEHSGAARRVSQRRELAFPDSASSCGRPLRKVLRFVPLRSG